MYKSIVQQAKELEEQRTKILKRAMSKNCGSYRQVCHQVDLINEQINKLLNLRKFSIYK